MSLLDSIRTLLQQSQQSAGLKPIPSDPNYVADKYGTQYRHFNSPVGPLNIVNAFRGPVNQNALAAPNTPTPLPTEIPAHQAAQYFGSPSPTPSASPSPSPTPSALPSEIPYSQAIEIFKTPHPFPSASPSATPSPSYNPKQFSGTKTMSQFLNAISQQESGGNYNAINKDSGAIGKYQIMPNNWGPWAKQAGLPSNAPTTPANQERIAQYQISQLYKKYGNWGDVASVWYSGRPQNQANQNAAQGNYPSIGGYVNSVLKRLK